MTMENVKPHVQYSKIFTSAAGIAYSAQVIATIVLVCLFPYQADALIDILGTTTGLIGLIFGCYSGNSAVEKYVVNKSAINSALSGYGQTQSTNTFG